MANQEQLEVLRQGKSVWNAWRQAAWNAWRQAHPDHPNLYPWLGDEDNRLEFDPISPDLRFASLRFADLRGADLRNADLEWGKLFCTDLSYADLQGANLRNAYLQGANLVGANLQGANLVGADLQGAILEGANLALANLVGSNLTGAYLTDCRVYGASIWQLKINDKTKQQNLVITHSGEPEVTVDNIELAQFVYLLLHNEKIRHVIDTITSKAVLILGRFTPERKAVLDALREELRKHDYLPILFDFDVPANRNITETVSLLARMARFIIADITDAKSIPQELMVIVPDLPSVPVQPLLLEGSGEYSMFEHLKRYPWMLGTYCYASQEQLIANLNERVIHPAEAKARELRGAKSEAGDSVA